IPTDLELMAVDARFPHEADPRDRTSVPGAGPKRRPPLAQVMHLQNYRPADAPDGQLTGYLVVHSTKTLAIRTLEGDGRVLGHIEEITAAQVVVALRLPGPQLVCLDCRLDGQLRRVVRVELQRTMHVLEMSPHPGHHHVSGAELCGGMTRL